MDVVSNVENMSKRSSNEELLCLYFCGELAKENGSKIETRLYDASFGATHDKLQDLRRFCYTGKMRDALCLLRHLTGEAIVFDNQPQILMSINFAKLCG
jgi:hypothetical protein